MNIILLFLTATLMGGFFIGFFCLGYYVGSHQKEEGVTVTENNKDFITELMKWRNF